MWRCTCRLLKDGREDLVGVVSKTCKGIDHPHHLRLEHHIPNYLFVGDAGHGKAGLAIIKGFNNLWKDHYC